MEPKQSNPFAHLEPNAWYFIAGEGPMFLRETAWGLQFCAPGTGHVYFANISQVTSKLTPEWVGKWLDYRKAVLSTPRDGHMIEMWEAWVEGEGKSHVTWMKDKTNEK